MMLQRGPLSFFVPKPGQYVIGRAHMGGCPLTIPHDMAVVLAVDIEGLRISHSPELTDGRICCVVEVDTRPWDSPLAQRARYRDDVHTRSASHGRYYRDIDLMFEAWRHSVLCVLKAPLTGAELRSLGIPSADRGYYKSLYLRYAPSEITPV